jgi:hypothetical protein
MTEAARNRYSRNASLAGPHPHGKITITLPGREPKQATSERRPAGDTVA